MSRKLIDTNKRHRLRSEFDLPNVPDRLKRRNTQALEDWRPIVGVMTLFR